MSHFLYIYFIIYIYVHLYDIYISLYIQTYEFKNIKIINKYYVKILWFNFKFSESFIV